MATDISPNEPFIEKEIQAGVFRTSPMPWMQGSCCCVAGRNSSLASMKDVVNWMKAISVTTTNSLGESVLRIEGTCAKVRGGTGHAMSRFRLSRQAAPILTDWRIILGSKIRAGFACWTDFTRHLSFSARIRWPARNDRTCGPAFSHFLDMPRTKLHGLRLSTRMTESKWLELSWVSRLPGDVRPRIVNHDRPHLAAAKPGLVFSRRVAAGGQRPPLIRPRGSRRDQRVPTCTFPEKTSRIEGRVRVNDRPNSQRSMQPLLRSKPRKFAAVGFTSVTWSSGQTCVGRHIVATSAYRVVVLRAFGSSLTSRSCLFPTGVARFPHPWPLLPSSDRPWMRKSCDAGVNREGMTGTSATTPKARRTTTGRRIWRRYGDRPRLASCSR